MFGHCHAPGHVTHLTTSASYSSATVGLGFNIDGESRRYRYPSALIENLD
jgi:hypothetical protein